MNQRAIDQWHHIVATGDLAALDELIGDDAVFSSPAVFTPQHGKAKTLMYLQAALKVFSGNDFRYIEEWHGRDSAVLEFVAELDGIHVNGVDLMHWDEHDRITSFKVMIRPLQGLQAVIPLMGIQLSQS